MVTKILCALLYLQCKWICMWKVGIIWGSIIKNQSDLSLLIHVQNH